MPHNVWSCVTQSSCGCHCVLSCRVLSLRIVIIMPTCSSILSGSKEGAAHPSATGGHAAAKDPPTAECVLLREAEKMAYQEWLAAGVLHADVSRRLTCAYKTGSPLLESLFAEERSASASVSSFLLALHDRQTAVKRATSGEIGSLVLL